MLLDLFSNPMDTLMSLLISLPGIFLALSAHEAAHGWVALKCGDPTAQMMGRITLNPLKHIDPIGFLCMLFAGFGWARPVPVNPNNFRNSRRDDLKVSLAGITANLILFVIAFTVAAGVISFAYTGMPEFESMDEYIEYLDENYLVDKDGFARENIAAIWMDEGEKLVSVVPAGEHAYIVGSDQSITVYYTAMGDDFFGADMLSLGYHLVSNAWGRAAEIAFEMLFSFIYLNLGLAAFNLIPVPPLDGYHVLNDLILKRALFADFKVQRMGTSLMFILIMLGNVSPKLDIISIVINFVTDQMLSAFTSIYHTLASVLNII